MSGVELALEKQQGRPLATIHNESRTCRWHTGFSDM